MEVVGAAASIVSIVVPAASLAQLAGSLYADLRGAPAHLDKLRNRVLVFHGIFDALAEIKNDALIPERDKQSLLPITQEVEAILRDLEKKAAQLTKKRGFLVRIKWVVLDRKEVETIEAQLHARESLLLTTLGLHSFRNQFSTSEHIKLAVLEKLQSLENHITGRQPSSRPGRNVSTSTNNVTAELGSGSQMPDAVPTNLYGVHKQTRVVSRSYRILSSQLPSWLRGLGLRGNIYRVIRQQSQHVVMYLGFYIPNLSNHSRKLGFKVIFIIRGGSPDPPLAIRTFNVVPPDAPIMKACAQGNFLRVQHLFESCQASVMDVTPENYSPLYYAINSGNSTLVNYLLNSGAAVNYTFGQNDTNPLQWALFRRQLDITRLFLNRGADGAHVSMRGWTPLFYLLAIAEKAVLDKISSTVDFLQVLQADEFVFLDLEAQDHQDMTVLDYVVRHGSGEEVKALLGLGAQLVPSITEKNKSGPGRSSRAVEEVDPWQLPNSAMSQAIASANISTFCALLETVPRHRIDSKYAGGWTMLHYAAYLGRDDMVRCLLEAGAEGFYVDLQEELEREAVNKGDSEGKRLTLTYDTYNRYLKSLEFYGKVAVRAANGEGQNGQEVFWDADEEWN